MVQFYPLSTSHYPSQDLWTHFRYPGCRLGRKSLWVRSTLFFKSADQSVTTTALSPTYTSSWDTAHGLGGVSQDRTIGESEISFAWILCDVLFKRERKTKKLLLHEQTLSHLMQIGTELLWFTKKKPTYTKHKSHLSQPRFRINFETLTINLQFGDTRSRIRHIDDEHFLES